MSVDLVLAPRSPLVFRTGKPFGATGGGDAMGFPPPATIAGALRAQFADTFNVLLNNHTDHENLQKRVTVKGPLLMHVKDTDAQVYFPCPADAVYLRNDRDPRSPKLLRARPRTSVNNGEGCDLPEYLHPVFLDAEENAKRADRPAFWLEHAMVNWLMNNAGPQMDGTSKMPPEDRRIHVAIDAETLAHIDGRLFQSTGLDFGPRRVERDNEFFENDAWGLLAQLSDTQGAKLDDLKNAVRRVGADGRSARLVAVDNAWPKINVNLSAALSALKKGDYLRLILATPAIFSGGWRPGWLKEEIDGGKSAYRGSPPGAANIRLELVAVAIERWTPFSGWDMKINKPRAIRRLAPAGSVYWFKLIAGSGADLLPLWLAPISDNEQDRRDGFGLALPGLADIGGTAK